ncbi:MAG: hypothetical protein A2958_00980 [Candidatus Levybacteria bacterium RIFCSPLOWO2_01_FULL_38_13]|nr:MAG: hypothetical protein A2629_00875 [Candidatus Levybacteria bacterium RIFCSPHIGHO2_01_FULL_41_15]OGH34861.1 MAG: hypothetical protein A2958_00980 [Candidatus Levybacteria bacterium RIFCSPLOWO2_01_FULL_38_13]
MKKLFIIANWKSNKTINEAEEWLEEISNIKYQISHIEYKEIILCPSFTLLPNLKSYIVNHKLPFKLGAQNVSKFREGAYTGEVTAQMISGLVKYCIVGHSERRKYFNENDDDVIEKIKLLLEYKIMPILCISDLSQLDSYVNRGRQIIGRSEEILFVYEPPDAISGGGEYKPDSPEDSNLYAGKIKERIGEIKILYGGSVNSDNVASFFSQPNIEGALVGQASLDPREFVEIIKNA